MIKFNQKTQWGEDNYVLLHNGEIADLAGQHSRFLEAKIREDNRWYGSRYSEFKQKVVTGDESLVKHSETFLAQIEDQVPMSRGWRNVDDVVGAVPNVPSFLAGHPQCMRRRERTMRDTAPLAIYMDLTSSAGFSERDVCNRGVVLLALTRLLVEHRPVELWVGTSLDINRRGSGTVAWKIDTAPLDLARAAFHIGATVMARGFGYGMCNQMLGCGGSWPFNSYSLHCETAKQRIAAVFPGQEMLYIPPVYVTDPMVTHPVDWLKRTMASYVQKEGE